MVHIWNPQQHEKRCRYLENLKKTKGLLLLVAFLLVVSLLQIKPVFAPEMYTMMGAYNEDGIRDGAINCTLTRVGQGATTFELDGTYLANASTTGVVFRFDIGYNESRTFHVYGNETIYVMKPYDPYYNYYFSVIDTIGLEWGYLESIVNLNGTDRVCERQNIDIVSDIPFTWSWGRSYTIKLVCNLGEYTYGTYVAGAKSEFDIIITSDLFPTLPTDIRNLSVSATRINASWIQAVYIDVNSSTNWVEFSFYEYGNSTSFLQYNTTSQTVTYNWYSAASYTSYYVIANVSHQDLGFKYWTFPCPAPNLDSANPFAALTLLGDFPFDITQLPAILLIIVVALAFTWYNAPIGIIASLLVAFILAWIGWLSIGWTWLSLAGSMGFVLAIAMQKDKEPR